MKLLLGALCAALLLPMEAMAGTAPSEAEIQAQYQRSIAARMAKRPDIAEAILRVLIKHRPKAPQLRFDLGVALAEQGRCVAAARAFDHGEQIAGIPSYSRAVEIAMEDLCPGLAPFDVSVGFNLVYDTNANGGAGNDSVDIGGIPILLSSDAVAKEAYGYQATASLAYNIRLGTASYIVPSVGLAITDYQGSDLDSYSLTPGLFFRFKGDRADWRVGPTAVLSYDSDGLASRGSGILGRAGIALTPRSGLYIDASSLQIRDQGNDLRDYRQDNIGVTFVRAPKGARVSLRAGLSYTNRDYRDDFQDLSSIQAQIGISGSLSRKVGYDLSYTYRFSEGSVPHFMFGTIRKDRINTLSASLSFANLEGWYGHPYIGVSYTDANSSWETKTYDRTRLLLGLTRRF